MEDQRTLKQNNSLHKFCDLLATELNGKGMDMRVVLKPDYKLRWDMKSVKENLYKPIAKALYGVESTTELDTSQVSKVHEQLMLMLVEKFPEVEYIDFPSEETTPEYIASYEKNNLEDISLSERILRYATKYPEWHNGGHFEEMAMRAGYKASNASRRLRELHEEGKLERKEEKTIKGKIKTVWYKIYASTLPTL